MIEIKNGLMNSPFFSAFGGVLKSMLSSDVTIIDIKEHQIKRLKVVIKLF